jgi:nucleoside-diphosphate-sugar epimerase
MEYLIGRVVYRVMAEKRILITGGSGFLGRAVAGKCVERGDRVFSLSRNPHKELEEKGVTQILGDVIDPVDVRNAVRGMDVVFHLAARTGLWGRMKGYYKTNVRGTRNIIAACKEENVGALVFTSCAHVLFDGSTTRTTCETEYPERFRSNFAMSKAFAEQAVKRASEDGLRTIILRPHLIWGPGEGTYPPGIVKNKSLFFRIGNGTNSVSAIFIDDAARAHLVAADKLLENSSISGKAYIISQREPMAIWEFIDKSRKIQGRQPLMFVLPEKMAAGFGRFLELTYKNLKIPFEPYLTSGMVKEFTLSSGFDCSNTEMDPDFKPEIGFEEGLEKYRCWKIGRAHV